MAKRRVNDQLIEGEKASPHASGHSRLSLVPNSKNQEIPPIRQVISSRSQSPSVDEVTGGGQVYKQFLQ